MNIIGNAGGNQVRGDGSFQLTNVPPGEYVLDVQQRPQNIRNLQDLNLAQLEFASMPLSVSGGDIDNLTIVTTPGVTVSGRVAYQGQGAAEADAAGDGGAAIGRPGPDRRADQRAGARRRTRQPGRHVRAARPRRTADDSRPGPSRSGWALKSITLDGADITDTRYDFKPGNNVTGLVITLTDRLTEVTGSVRDARGQPVDRLRARRVPRRYEALGRAVALRADDAAKSERHVQHQGAAAGTLSRRGRSRSRKRITERSRRARTASPARAAAFRWPKVKR